MSEQVQHIAEYCAAGLEMLGIGLIVLFALLSTVRAVVDRFRGQATETIFRKYRQQLARGILLALELLVAADIVHTVAVNLSYDSVGVLAIVVLIRTFLSFTLELELNGRWPWQPTQKKESK
jgi:uncharacterized membrane protein